MSENIRESDIYLLGTDYIVIGQYESNHNHACYRVLHDGSYKLEQHNESEFDKAHLVYEGSGNFDTTLTNLRLNGTRLFKTLILTIEDYAKHFGTRSHYYDFRTQLPQSIPRKEVEFDVAGKEVTFRVYDDGDTELRIGNNAEPLVFQNLSVQKAYNIVRALVDNLEGYE